MVEDIFAGSTDQEKFTHRNSHAEFCVATPTLGSLSRTNGKENDGITVQQVLAVIFRVLAQKGGRYIREFYLGIRMFTQPTGGNAKPQDTEFVGILAYSVTP